MKSELFFYLFIRKYPMSENLQRLLNKGKQKVDYSLVQSTEYVLMQEASSFEVINFYLFSWDELSMVLSAALSIFINLFVKFVHFRKIY